MRVLHLYSGNMYGGIERMLVTVARRRADAGMEPEFGLCFRGRLFDELSAAGVTVHDLGPVRVSRPWTVLRARRRLANVVRTRAPDVVATHASWTHAIFGPVARRASVRLAHFVHGAMGEGHWTERLAARTEPDVVVAGSRFTAGTTTRVFPRQTPRSVIYPVDLAVGTADRVHTRTKLGAGPATIVLLAASRLDLCKGHVVLFEALARLLDLGNWECWIAGGPQSAAEVRYDAAFRSRASALGVASRVRFLGPRADVPDLMAAADVFCQANTGPEAFGIVFVEALAAGIPVVTSAIGGALEIVDESCGALVPPSDPAGLAALLRALVLDPVRRRALGVAGRERALALCDPTRQMPLLAAALAADVPA